MDGTGGTLSRDATRSLIVGGAVALVFSVVPFLSFVFSYLLTLVHELGHAVSGWFFGYPSIPAFDFAHGGGVTMHEDRKVLLMLAIYALFGWGFYALRRRPVAATTLAVLVALYSVAAFTPLHEILQIFMGHGAELIFAGLFLYRALSGEKIRTPAERPAYAFAGFFILFSDLRFAYGLWSNHERRVEYELAKGGGSWMDFSRIARDYLGVELTTVAAFFLLLCLLVPPAVWLAFRFRSRVREGVDRLLQVA